MFPVLRIFGNAYFGLEGNIDAAKRYTGAENIFDPVRVVQGVFKTAVRQNQDEFIGADMTEDVTGIEVEF